VDPDALDVDAPDAFYQHPTGRSHAGPAENNHTRTDTRKVNATDSSLDQWSSVFTQVILL